MNQQLDPLREELQRRLLCLDTPPHSTSECLGSTRGVLFEAAAWILGAAAVWVTAVTLP